MARTKYTARNKPKRPPVAVKAPAVKVAAAKKK